MNKTVGSLISKNLIVVNVDERVENVIETLDKNELCCIPVVDSHGRCFGVISASDLVHFQKMKLNPKAELAWEVCTHNFIEVSPDVTAKEAAVLMVDNKIHHIIVSEGSILKGIISSMDIIEKFLLK